MRKSQATSGPFIWILLDGLPAEVAKGFAARRPDSLIARCLRRELSCQGSRLRPLSPNCQTPPSLFTIWSGLETAEHDLTGYDVPTGPTHYTDGFSAWPRATRMAWDRLAAQGYRLRLYAMPFVQPKRLGEALCSHLHIYGATQVAPVVLRPGQKWEIPELDVNREVVWHPDGVAVGKATIVVGQTVLLEAGGLHVPAACIRVSKEPLLAIFGLRQTETVTGAEKPCATSSPSAIASNPGLFYQRGLLGQRLAEGGDGSAESALLDLMQVVHHSFLDDILAQLRAGDADVIFAYYPVIDLLCHQLLRYAHPATSTPHERTLLEPLFDQALAAVDDLLVQCLRSAPGAQLLAHSDHGMQPVLYDVYANVALQRCGWLQFDQSGQVDLDQTLAFLHPAANGLIVFNPQRLKRQGLSEHDIVESLRTKLPEPLRHGWQGIEGPRAQLDAHWQSSTYLQAPPGARWRPSLADHVVMASGKGGDHTVTSDDCWLSGVLFAVGSDFEALPEPAMNLRSLLPMALRAIKRASVPI